MPKPVIVAGAGPAGLAAALAIAQGGGQARVLERRADLGARFHGDFQGLENWSTEGDVLEELAALGIQATFDYTPFYECVFFAPDGSEHVCRAARPLWYLVRRGPGSGTLDDALKTQAVAAGVQIELGQPADRLADGGIVAHGPRRADIIAVGYLFETDRADGAFGAVSNQLAPEGYSYLLISGGRATLATCLFTDFHNDRVYLERTVDYFKRKVGITLQGEKRFGGLGNMAVAPSLQRGKLLFAGEAAGLQDALFGFGMRYAMISGHLAGLAYGSGDLSSYQRACAQRLLPLSQAATANRYLYARSGALTQRMLLRRLCSAADARAWLGHRHRPRWWTRLVYQFARADARRRQRHGLEHRCREDCDCTYCRCIRELTAA